MKSSVVFIQALLATVMAAPIANRSTAEGVAERPDGTLVLRQHQGPTGAVVERELLDPNTLEAVKVQTIHGYEPTDFLTSADHDSGAENDHSTSSRPNMSATSQHNSASQVQNSRQQYGERVQANAGNSQPQGYENGDPHSFSTGTQYGPFQTGNSAPAPSDVAARPVSEQGVLPVSSSPGQTSRDQEPGMRKPNDGDKLSDHEYPTRGDYGREPSGAEPYGREPYEREPYGRPYEREPYGRESYGPYGPEPYGYPGFHPRVPYGREPCGYTPVYNNDCGYQEGSNECGNGGCGNVISSYNHCGNRLAGSAGRCTRYLFCPWSWFLGCGSNGCGGSGGGNGCGSSNCGGNGNKCAGRTYVQPAPVAPVACPPPAPRVPERQPYVPAPRYYQPEYVPPVPRYQPQYQECDHSAYDNCYSCDTGAGSGCGTGSECMKHIFCPKNWFQGNGCGGGDNCGTGNDYHCENSYYQQPASSYSQPPHFSSYGYAHNGYTPRGYVY